MVQARGLIFNPTASAVALASLEIEFQPAMIISARKLDKLGLRLRSMKKPLHACVKFVMIPSIRKNFDEGGRDPKWAELAPSTQWKKHYQGYNWETPLIRTGLLRRKMGYLNIWHIDAEKAYIKDLPKDIWYGKVHQSGAHFRVRGGGFNLQAPEHVEIMKMLGRSHGGSDTGETGYIPARPFVVLREQDIARMQRIFDEWLGQEIRKVGMSH